MIEDKKNVNYEEFLAGVDSMKDQYRDEQFLEGISKAHRDTPDELEELGPVGERVQRIRTEKGLTLADVASRTGFEEDFLKSIEEGDQSPPLGVLIKLAKALDMKMGYFISGGETRSYTVVRENERQKIARRATVEDNKYGYTYQALAPGKTNRQMEPFMITLEPSEEEEISTHEGQEFIYVMEGKMEAIIDRERIILGPGDSIYYDSSAPHMVRCVDGPCTKILAVLYAYDK